MIRAVTVRRLASASILVTAAAGLTVSLTPAPLPPVADRQEIRPGLIGPTSAAFAPSAQAGAITIKPATIASGSTVLAPAVSVGAVRIAPAAIPSAASAYPPAVRLMDPQAATIAPERIEPTSIVFEPVVSPGAATLAVPAIASSATVTTPVISSGAATITPDHIASAASVPPPSVAPGAVTVAPQPITSMASVFVPDARPGAVTLALPAIASTAAAFAPIVSVPASGYDADAQAYFNAMTVQPSDTVKARVSDFIAGLKADGLWALIEWISLRALHDTQSARLDMRNPSRSSTISGAPSFTPGKGFMGDGASYLGTGITNASAALFMQDSATLFSFVNVSGNGPLVGASSNTFLRTGNANTQDGRVNSATNTSITNAPGPLGFAAVSRLNATTQRHFRNGQLIGTGSAASASAAMNEIRFYQASGIGTFAGRSALEGFGAGMTDAQVASLNNRVQTLINAIGAN